MKDTYNHIPILQSLHDWLLQTRTQTADGGGTAKAIDHTLKHWQSLIRYTDSGHLPIDNNPVENTIRPIAIGKKNWLFTGSERARKRAAATQTYSIADRSPSSFFLPALRPVKNHPSHKVVAEVFEAVFGSGRHEKHVIGAERHALLTIEKHACALCHDIHFETFAKSPFFRKTGVNA